MGHSTSRSSRCRAARCHSPSSQASIAVACARSRSLTRRRMQGGEVIARRVEVAGVGRHQMQVGGERLAHRERRVVGRPGWSSGRRRRRGSAPDGRSPRRSVRSPRLGRPVGLPCSSAEAVGLVVMVLMVVPRRGSGRSRSLSCMMPTGDCSDVAGRSQHRCHRFTIHEVQYRVLGEVDVVVDGKVHQIGSPNQRLVLSALLAHPNAVVTTQRPDRRRCGTTSLPLRRLSTLRTYVSRLRRLVGADLVADASGYRLARRPVRHRREAVRATPRRGGCCDPCPGARAARRGAGHVARPGVRRSCRHSADPRCSSTSRRAAGQCTRTAGRGPAGVRRARARPSPTRPRSSPTIPAEKGCGSHSSTRS